MSSDNEVEALKSKLRKKPGGALDPNLFARGLSTGSTLLNLACTGRISIGYLPGHFYLLVGDSSSGKTWMAHSLLAEASINKKFNDYRLIYDNAEDGALMDIKRFFGERVAQRLESPSKLQDRPVYSGTIESFFYHLDDAVQENKPFIYVLDSMDSLSSEDEGEKFQKQKTAYLRGKDAAGSFGDGKAKKNSSGIRQSLHKLKKTGSILIVITQTRDNIGFGAQFNPKTRSGGRALTFYATTEIWFSIKERIKKHIRGKDRQLGILSKIQVKRTRTTGGEYAVEVPIYRSHGIDDTGSMIDYLIEEKHWEASDKGGIVASEFHFKGNREKLVSVIESKSLEKDLRLLVADTWNAIEEACKVERKNRYQ